MAARVTVALRNLNLVVISVVMMLGAAGRTGEVNQANPRVRFKDDLGLSLALKGRRRRWCGSARSAGWSACVGYRIGHRANG
jgi:hypothetical protein